ncbi:MAG: response regulator transcription factor [Opitutia bacterium]|jgi:two-component system phosphate regulon response regulator PhoB
MEKADEKRVLVVDDEKDVTELLEYKLKQAGLLVRSLNDPLRVIGMARDLRPDLIILDVMMPDLTGMQLLRMIRSDALLQDTPVMFLTAKGETEERLKGLEGGADDYLAKPFDPRELVLRAQALLRRAKSAAAKPDSRLAAGSVVIDLERHEVTAGGKPVELTATEFKLLRTLVERKGRVQTRDRLLEDVWNYAPDLETRTVDTHMRRLREKLGRAGEVIETIRGVGYRAQG